MRITKYVVETNGFYLAAFTMAKRKLYKEELRSIQLYDYEESDKGYILTFGPTSEFDWVEKDVIPKLEKLLRKAAKIANYEGQPTKYEVVRVEKLDDTPPKIELVTNQVPEHVSITHLFSFTGESR